MSTIEQKKKMVETVVYDHFKPRLKLEVANLILKSVERISKNNELSELAGTNVMVDEAPIVFHIKALTKDLVDNLVVIFDDQNGYPKKDNS